MKSDTEHFVQLRRAMVQQQIASRGVKDPRVLDAMRKAPRHLFVPPELVPEAYNDYPLPVGMGQTISQPYIVAQMTELLELEGKERVLEIGTGSGYQAAVLAQLVKDVYTVEIVESLASAAADRFINLHYANIHVRFGDGYQGWTEAAPFDAIIVTAAAPYVPDSLKTQLKEGGRLVMPVDDGYGDQMLTLYRKQNGELKATTLEPVRFVPMRGKVEKNDE
jgi:protein-L-isoaspartate(D-aspartate) O-methyltransferase